MLVSFTFYNKENKNEICNCKNVARTDTVSRLLLADLKKGKNEKYYHVKYYSINLF